MNLSVEIKWFIYRRSNLVRINKFLAGLKLHIFKKVNFIYFCTCPWLLKPRISWLIQEVLPVWISCKWRNRLSLALPRPLSNSPWVSTPSNVDLPASTFPSTANFRSINWRTENKNEFQKLLQCETNRSQCGLDNDFLT